MLGMNQVMLLSDIGCSLVFPRWDAIAIMFSVFLLTYTYIEARSNYYRGSILVLRCVAHV